MEVDSQLFHIKVALDGSGSGYMPVNTGVPQGCVLSPTLFLLHIYDILENSSIHCYADDYSDRTSFSWENVDQCRKNLVSSIEASLRNVSSEGERDLVQFNPNTSLRVNY